MFGLIVGLVVGAAVAAGVPAVYKFFTKQEAAVKSAVVGNPVVSVVANVVHEATSTK